MLRVERNFEEVLAQRRKAAQSGGDEQPVEDVRRLEGAILETFAGMNWAIARRANLSFSEMSRRSISRYLARFDAIYTLNQDLLLEFHYDPRLIDPTRWIGHVFPGVTIPHEWRIASNEEVLSNDHDWKAVSLGGPASADF